MDTPKKDSFQVKDNFSGRCICVSASVCLGLVAITWGEALLKKLVIKSDRSIQTTLSETSQARINELKQRVLDSTSDALRLRAGYEIGLIYFKNKAYLQAKPYFLVVANTEDGSVLLKACALNMLGHTFEELGEVERMIETYGQLRDVLSPVIDSSSTSPKEWTVKLLFQALFIRAEVFQIQGNLQKAIEEYISVKTLIERMTDSSIRDGYLAIALDRLAQLYLKQGKDAMYNQYTETIIKRCPHYYRNGVIELERRCVDVLKQVRPEMRLTEGSLSAPAVLIRDVNENSSSETITYILREMERLQTTYLDSFSGIIVKYHHAWLLDRIGRKEKALKLFSEIAAITPSPDGEKRKTLVTLRQYATLQQAILLGEAYRYNEGQKVLRSLEILETGSHQWNLKESILDSLETLRREVPPDVGQ